MKKIIFALFICLFMIPSINAEEYPNVPIEGMGFANSCSKNLLKPGWGIAGFYNNFVIIDDSSNTPALNNFIPVSGSTTYYYSSNFNKFCTFLEFDKDLKFIYQFQKWPNFSFKTMAKTAYLNFTCTTTVDEISSPNNWFQLELGNSKTEYVAYEEESIVEPDIPDEPIIADTTLDIFYSIFISKIQILFNYALENKFILGSLCIIILFIILELILYLFRRGGYR